MRHETTLLALVSLAMLAAASGCGFGEEQIDERRFFLLEAIRTEQLPAPPQGPILAVRRLQVAPGLSEKELVYRTSTVAYESDYYNQFLSAAGTLIAEQTRRWLARAGLFAAGVNTGSDVLPTHVIEGNVVALYGDFRNDEAPAGVVAVELFLIDESGDDPTVVFHKGYRAAVPLSARTAEGLVTAYNEALTQLLAAFEADLRKTLGAPPGTR